MWCISLKAHHARPNKLYLPLSSWQYLPCSWKSVRLGFRVSMSLLSSPSISSSCMLRDVLCSACREALWMGGVWAGRGELRVLAWGGSLGGIPEEGCWCPLGEKWGKPWGVGGRNRGWWLRAPVGTCNGCLRTWLDMARCAEVKEGAIA